MVYRWLVFFIGILCLTFSFNNMVVATSNLLKNPSFELDDSLSSWKKNIYSNEDQVEFSIEKNGTTFGNKSLTISSFVPNDVRLVQTINVDQNMLYRFSAWLKVKDVPKGSKGANLSVIGELVTSLDIHGTEEEWQYRELYISTGDTTSLNLSIGLGGYGSLNSGEASFDNIVLEKVSSMPEGSLSISLQQESTDESTPKKEAGSSKPIIPLYLVYLSFFVSFVTILLFFIYVWYFEKEKTIVLPSNESDLLDSSYERDYSSDEDLT
jgi:dolichyl-phosphate-mannose-protein mannosyltransferase